MIVLMINVNILKLVIKLSIQKNCQITSEMVLQSIKLKVEKFKIVNSCRFTLKKIKLVNRLAKQNTIDQTKFMKIIIISRLKIYCI